tara:strand:+ start:836 stop:991 length:156 start_codon:yes stop_codon:yes gene_type:complete
MDYDKDKYKLDIKDILSNLQVKIPEGYIEVKVAEDNTKEDIKDKKTEQERQ